MYRTRDQWIEITLVTIEHICGYASIPIDVCVTQNIVPADIIQGREGWRYIQGKTVLGFQKGISRPVFGDLKEKKKIKVNADYVWQSLI